MMIGIRQIDRGSQIGIVHGVDDAKGAECWSAVVADGGVVVVAAHRVVGVVDDAERYNGVRD